MAASRVSSLLQAALEHAPQADKSRLPISDHDFYERLMGLWRRWKPRLNYPGRPTKLALAVSGGADSMALAYLCSPAHSERHLPGLEVKPFIVDHQARPDSQAEAQTVARWLRKMGFEPQILILDWPQGVNPSQLPDFESQARTLRYQALGRACSRARIHSLLLGHHQDDNLETVLLRLAQGHRGLGLQGIPDVAHIPECHDLYGVAESGTVLAQALAVQAKYGRTRLDYAQRGYQHFFLRVADGGIHLLRPLASYPKSRLVATCEAYSVPFVNDPTNFDRTLTPRNTVRHLLASGELPRALRAPSLSRLIENSKAKTERIQALSERFFRSFVILKHDAPVGSLLVSLPNLTKPEHLSSEIENEIRHNQYAQALALRDLLDVVAPGPRRTASLDKVGCAALKVFQPIRIKSSGTLVGRSSFTLGGMKWENVQIGMRDSNRWLLTRQPFKGDTPKPTITCTASFRPSERGHNTFSQWQLWDGRYWFRARVFQVDGPESSVLGNPPVPITQDHLELAISPLTEADVFSLRQGLRDDANGDADVAREIEHILKTRAPGKVRFTLPAVRLRYGDQRLLGLPSLLKDLRQVFVRTTVDDSGVPRKSYWRVKCEVRHKHIDSSFFKLEGFV
ncbi:hypothetical protein KEM52_003218 [Ascosphaera acerosa]|nr:hypothetical protein KEM52_003218 [Ascosphaera acerosa]